MKIREMQITKDIKHWEGDPEDLLKKYGWKVIGDGLDGAVAEHPSKPYVLKLFQSDSKYVHFVDFVKHHTSNVHLPKFSRWVKKVPGMQEAEYSYVRMEKLSKINSIILINDYLPEVFAMKLAGQKRSISPSFRIDAMMFVKLEDMGFKDIDLFDKRTIDKIWTALKRKPGQAWFNICDDLMADAEKLGYRAIDLHGGNIMLRGNILVIIDPY